MTIYFLSKTLLDFIVVFKTTVNTDTFRIDDFDDIVLVFGLLKYNLRTTLTN